MSYTDKQDAAHLDTDDLETLYRNAQRLIEDFGSLETDTNRAALHVINGPHDQKRFGSGEKFWQFRNYDQSDRPQDIDWRQSAKTDSVFIRQKEHQTTQSVLFWCASHAGMAYRSDKKLQSKAEQAKILSLALAILANQAGDLIGSFGSTQKGRGTAALDRLAQRLIDKKDNAPLPQTSVFKLPQHATLVQIGDYLEDIDDIRACFEHLAARSQNGLVIQILDPAECDLPFSGRAVFQDQNSHDRFQVDSVESVQHAYQEKIRAHCQSIESTCSSLGWEYFFHRTDADMRDTLAQICARMNLAEHDTHTKNAPQPSVQSGRKDRAPDHDVRSTPAQSENRSTDEDALSSSHEKGGV